MLGHKQNLNINKILIKFFILIVAISSSVESVSAKEFRGIHYTTLLPIITNLDVTIHDQVFKNMEKGLVGYKSVKYKSNAGLFNILNKDKAKLRENLYTDAVIKTVGKRLLVGSIIRVEINSFLMGYEVTFDVLSSDGENMFHRKKTTYQKSVKLLNSLLDFWIKGYIDTFPYDATIEGVQGDKAFIDFPGEKEEIYPNRQFIIKRYISSNNKYVSKDTFLTIGYGVITNIQEDFFIGKILKTEDQYKVSQNDFIIFDVFDESIALKNPDYIYRIHDISNYRERGKLSLLGTSMSIEGEGSTATFTGANLGIEFYLPGRLLALIEFSKKVGQSSGDTSNVSSVSSSSLDDNSYKALIGYSVSAKRWQYVSYLDVYVGWAVEQRYLAGLGIIGVGDISFEGVVVGVRTEHPVYKNLAATAEIDYDIQPRFKEKESLLGEAKSTSGYGIQIGMRYRFEKSGFSIESKLKKKYNTAEFQDSPVKLNISSTQLMLGVSKFF